MEKAVREKIIYTNIPTYKVDEKDCQNLALKSVLYGIGRVLVGPVSVPVVRPIVEGKGVEIGVAVSYPSGAYFPDAKAEEIEELAALYPEVDAYYMVMAVGRFLSGYEKEALEEMKLAVQAAQGRKVYVVTEAAVLDDAQMKKVCDFAAEAGLSGVVDTTGFEPYGVPFPTAEQTARLVKAAAGRLPVIAGYAASLAEAQEKIDAGADSVVMTEIDELI